MRRIASLFLVCLSVSALGACGSGSGAPDARPISLTDAPPPDAAPPDAFVCNETDTVKECSSGPAGCVDITMDNQNCGGCGVACASPGHVCVKGSGTDADAGGTDIAHCECPPTDFVPATIAGIDLSAFGGTNVMGVGGSLYVGIALFQEAGNFQFDALLSTFDLDPSTGTAIGTDIDLSTISGTSPRIALGYNIDTSNLSFQIAYGAVSGTLHLDYACATGVKGTVTNADFVEVQATANPTPVENGCGFHVDSIAFSTGADCTTIPDAGVPPDATADASN